MSQLVGKVLSITNTVSVRNEDGMIKVLAQGDEIFANDTLVCNDPQASIKLQYSGLETTTTYAGVFDEIFISKSVYAPADITNNGLDLESLKVGYLEILVGEGSDSDTGSIDLLSVTTNSMNKMKLNADTELSINIEDVIRLSDDDNELIIALDNENTANKVKVDTVGLTKGTDIEKADGSKYETYFGENDVKLLIEIEPTIA